MSQLSEKDWRLAEASCKCGNSWVVWFPRRQDPKCPKCQKSGRITKRERRR